MIEVAMTGEQQIDRGGAAHDIEHLFHGRYVRSERARGARKSAPATVECVLGYARDVPVDQDVLITDLKIHIGNRHPRHIDVRWACNGM
jgi:hypothetical protein